MQIISSENSSVQQESGGPVSRAENALAHRTGRQRYSAEVAPKIAPVRASAILCDIEAGGTAETIETINMGRERSVDSADGAGERGEAGAPIYALSIPERQTGRVISALAGLVRQTPDGPARPLYCLDGGNAFNPYRLTTWMRRRGYAPTPWLDNIFVSRAYTCHQLVSSAETLLAPLLAKPEAMPLVALLGIDHLFLDEDLAMWERRFLFGRLMNLVAQYAAEGLPMLITYGTERPNPWARQIARVACVLPGLGDGEPDRLGESLAKIEAAFAGAGQTLTLSDTEFSYERGATRDGFAQVG